MKEKEGGSDMKRSIEEIIKRVDATMALEDMPLTEEDKQRIRDINEGRTTSEEERQKLIEKYRR